jgi:hypothetical protein
MLFGETLAHINANCRELIGRPLCSVRATLHCMCICSIKLVSSYEADCMVTDH